jgi:hypothetical protein
LLIGVEDITLSELTTGDRDPEGLEGNSGPLLENSELLISFPDENRKGPPIYIFRVDSITKD